MGTARNAKVSFYRMVFLLIESIRWISLTTLSHAPQLLISVLVSRQTPLHALAQGYSCGGRKYNMVLLPVLQAKCKLCLGWQERQLHTIERKGYCLGEGCCHCSRDQLTTTDSCEDRVLPKVKRTKRSTNFAIGKSFTSTGVFFKQNTLSLSIIDQRKSPNEL